MVIILSVIVSIASIALVVLSIYSYFILGHNKSLISKKDYKKRYASKK